MHPRPRLAGSIVALVVFASALDVRAEDPNLCDIPGEAPDVIAASIDTVARIGTVGGITAYSIGVTDCNPGSCWVDWFASDARHPVMGQNLFRLEDGRFEQIGQAWVKHAFVALSGTLCDPGCQPTNGSHLGVHCSNPNSASSESYQSQLGPKHEVDATSGVFPYPHGAAGQTGNSIYKRLQVHDVDVHPAQHPGASFFFEAQQVARDDAAAGNDANNVSYRRAVVSNAGGVLSFALSGSTQVGQTALQAWRAADPDVEETVVEVPGDGRFILAAKVTEQGDGTWRYEYAVQNLTSHRAAGAFAVPLPWGANIGGVGFHDVEYHSQSNDGSGSYYDGVDWPYAVSDSELRWATASAAVDLLANALRWGTLYNFRFTADVPPAAGAATLALFLPGIPDSVQVPTLVPRACDGDAVCDPGESCVSCPDDCPEQGGADADSPEACDCDASNPAVWLPSGPIDGLALSRASAGLTELSWNEPAQPGAEEVTYSVLRSGNPWNFLTNTTCVADNDVADTLATDGESPTAGASFYYLVRAVNGCPQGQGSLGRSSSNVPREGRACP